ncbi:hypothetical protein [Geminocystis sp. GBBB08]|uniref:hypothetical protein n=1 Tax=Geminocystis sp. GBBB08 TaxID=2604140 RepID=UPI0027E3AFA4|nr:hypothetical protein [Geminocystis sp. GBBB08]MBL1211164.1 hypothetical protein [Geminocystis sp. GBBB08]
MNQNDYLSQCHQILNNAITKLGFLVTDDKIREISELIIAGMTQNSRYFHNFKHILMVSNTHSDYPLITLAGLFHDLVYLQVDEKIPFNLTPYLTPFINENNNHLFIKKSLNYQDNSFQIVLNIFSVKLGQNLSKYNGKNEFLSALVGAKVLESILPLSLLTQIVTLIELTIPFRHIDGEITDITLLLKKRLERVNNQFNLGLQDQDIINTITQAVIMANLDVSGFASNNVMDFINNTWLLLPETNRCLRDTKKYTIKEYRIALGNTLQFLDYLSPKFIYHRYNNQPSEKIFQGLINSTEYNLKIIRLFLKAKLVSLSLLEAICLRFYPEISLSFLFGIHSNIESKHSSLTDFLPLFNFYTPTDKIENETLMLLESECPNFFEYPLKQNIFTTFVVKYLTFSKIILYQPKCYLFFDNKITNEEFLQLFPLQLITFISEAIAKLLAQKQKLVLKKL